MTLNTKHLSWKPVARLGWWAVWLGAAFVVMFVINAFVFMAMPSFGDGTWRQMILPFYGILMLLCGLASGIAGVVAVIRQHERSWLVWLTLLPGLWVIFMLAGEFLFPH
jgi:hypothetical protein